MNVVVLGGTGQVGFLTKLSAPEHFSVWAPDRSELDCTDPKAVYDYLIEKRPDWIINVAAYTNVDQAEDHFWEASDLNTGLPTAIAWASLITGSKVLYLSTDYVFDGLAQRPYKTTDPVNPINTYGHTKLSGEQALADILPSDSFCILRTSGVYSHRRSNFFISIFTKLACGETCRVVDDQFTRFTSAKVLAKICWFIVSEGITGIYHFGESDPISRFDFAQKIHDVISQRGVCPQLGNVVPIKTHEITTRALRPSYSVLENTLFFSEPSLDFASWESSLSQVLNKYAFLSISDE